MFYFSVLGKEEEEADSVRERQEKQERLKRVTYV